MLIVHVIKAAWTVAEIIMCEVKVGNKMKLTVGVGNKMKLTVGLPQLKVVRYIRSISSRIGNDWNSVMPADPEGVIIILKPSGALIEERDYAQLSVKNENILRHFLWITEEGWYSREAENEWQRNDHAVDFHVDRAAIVGQALSLDPGSRDEQTSFSFLTAIGVIGGEGGLGGTGRH
ncbi:hypothetical protein BDP27DRAFT_1366192 [Rhodocollybia butyracea]|uniref:Uncharacterized protein n=1 Tax=Rhodocollybia butyracea TaxID=206335 RepID=A0A9P5PM01_9AGAR|nr:hypothetical protein BDP27DRAFT_1366192 [Rhodocollybia butyracea]